VAQFPPRQDLNIVALEAGARRGALRVALNRRNRCVADKSIAAERASRTPQRIPGSALTIGHSPLSRLKKFGLGKKPLTAKEYQKKFWRHSDSGEEAPDSNKLPQERFFAQSQRSRRRRSGFFATGFNAAGPPDQLNAPDYATARGGTPAVNCLMFQACLLLSLPLAALAYIPCPLGTQLESN